MCKCACVCTGICTVDQACSENVRMSIAGYFVSEKVSRQWNPLVWTPWGPGRVSCIQWNPSTVDTLGTW